MDINSLLSPTASEVQRSTSLGPGTSPASSTSGQSSARSIQRTHSGPPAQLASLKAGSVGSPLSREILPPSSVPAHIRSPSQRPLHSSPLISPVPTDPSQQPPPPRSSSTQSMDTLADLALQNHPAPLSTPPPFRTNSQDTQRPSALGNRPSFDIAMVETPKNLLRGDYTGTSLPLPTQQRLAELVGTVHETPSAYEAHLEIIKILHQGLVDHIYPSSSPNARNEPSSYDLLSELRQARESADKLFAVGEDLWLDWLQDESILAQSAEERVAVIELCKRAIDEEPGSSRLWQTYGDWVLHCYTWAHEPSSNGDDEEKLVGKEIFLLTDVTNTWDEAVRATRYDIALSHVVWNKFIKSRHPNFESKVTDQEAVQILELFQSRLVVPHAQWDGTFQAFSSFVSANFNPQQYEQIMAETLEIAAAAKAIWQSRESYESNIARAAQDGDKYAEYQYYIDYITWEREEELRISNLGKKFKKREPIQDPAACARLINALYQRAQLRIPSVVSIWEDHANYLAERRARERDNTDLLQVLVRATKHCPWSGSLWKRLLLASEIADQPFQEIEAIKHNATKTGMLDAAGIEESLKVHDAWCGYLVRRTRRADATEEDADVAEMGIRTSMEAVQSQASKLDGEINTDASFRLQRKYIEYLKGQGRFDNARKQFDDAAQTYGRFYRFWLRFYEFEMQASLHISSLQQDSRDGVTLHSSTPFAVGILKKGLEYPGLDYPEYLIEALVNHCEDYEDAEEVQSALLFVDKIQKSLNVRRQQEAQYAAEQSAIQPVEAVADERTEAVASSLHIGKRKRDEAADDDDGHKRLKNDDAAEQSVEQAPQEQLKRDREHASVLVQNVPIGVSETRIRQYFRDCGNVISIKQLDGDDRSFIVEFREAVEAQFALSRNEQELEGGILSVTLHTGNTLYVTNYPATADEDYMRDLFQPYGEVISVRFPSLQVNKRRRFCYVELKSAAEAREALALDGKNIQDLELVVKISNPAIRKERDTADHGRTVFVGQLPFKASEEEVKAAFAPYGDIESLKMPHDPSIKARNKGICFVTYVAKPSADAALQMNGQDFQGRKLKVNIATDDKATHKKSTSNRGGRSASPAVNGNASKSPAPISLADLEEQRTRTIALGDIPDTINEAQIRAVAENVGPVRKVLLRARHSGALIEFENAADAGKAALALEGHEFAPGRPASIVTQEALKQMTAEHFTDRLDVASAKSKGPKPTTTATHMAPANVRRPQQPGVRKGGHLGQRTGLGFRAAQPASEGGEATNQVEKKSNDDFRAMLEKKE